MNTASSASWPLTDGMAISSRRRSISPAKIPPQIRRLLLAADDHRAAACSGEHLEQQGIGYPTIDDVGTLDPPGGRPNARLDFRAHATAERAVGHEAGKIVGVGEGDQRGRVGAIAQHAGSTGEEY